MSNITTNQKAITAEANRELEFGEDGLDFSVVEDRERKRFEEDPENWVVANPKCRIPVLIRQAPNANAGETGLQVVGVIRAGDLVSRFQVAIRVWDQDYTKQSGYQRPVSQTRVNKLVASLRAKDVDLPTSVLLNIREYDMLGPLISEGEQTFLDLEGALLHVVDGQHRIQALKQLVAENPKHWADFPIAFVCYLGANEDQELKEFYVVNSTAKSVSTDLALDLLHQRARSDPKFKEELFTKGEDWKVAAQTITQDLAKEGIWKGLIRFANQPKGTTVIRSAGMVSSLKQVIGAPNFERIKTPDKVKILNAMWEGLKKVLPKAFDPSTDYSLQKTTGVMIVHKILPNAFEVLRTNGKSVIDPDSFEDVLRKPFQELQGENAKGQPVEGADFWRVGADGAAGAFSNNAGRRVLVARLKAKLPEIPVT